ncbi:hypothetical protein SNE40_018668 [Patella caerulea]|uniref:DUF19 domain-containing protein n=1 Tax=Patella caerulea TaxID=87958 RepID=A0AAN8J5C3_PATCE
MYSIILVLAFFGFFRIFEAVGVSKCSEELRKCESERDQTIQKAKDDIKIICPAWQTYVQCQELAKAFCNVESYVQKSIDFFKQKIQISCGKELDAVICGNASYCLDSLAVELRENGNSFKANLYKTCNHFTKYLGCEADFETRCRSPAINGDSLTFRLLHNVTRRYCDQILKPYPFDKCLNFSRCSKRIDLSEFGPSFDIAGNTSFWCGYLKRSLSCANDAALDEDCTMTQNTAMKLHIHILLKSKLNNSCPLEATLPLLTSPIIIDDSTNGSGTVVNFVNWIIVVLVQLFTII